MLSRRRFMASAASLGAAATLGPRATFAQTAAPFQLRVESRILEVKGRAASAFGILDSSGRHGLDLWMSEGFDLRLENATEAATLIHWHGLTPPFAQDGTHLAQPLIAPGESHDYQFALGHAGTHWMHSHHGLSEQLLMAAPLIVRADDERGLDQQDVTVMLHDFTFTPPEEILAGLTQMSGMDHSQMDMSGMAMDLNDVDYDAYLANDRDLSDPFVAPVDPGGRVRLRIINAASSTNFWIDLGGLAGHLAAADGVEVQPLTGSRFEIAMAQRLDIVVTIPGGGGAFPILAQREGDRIRTGIVLATPGAEVGRIDEMAVAEAPPVGLRLERMLAATSPLSDRRPDRRIALDLTGDMMSYAWGLNGQAFGQHVPLEVGLGERVEITLANDTMMAHPMHLHGHRFQVVALGATRLKGALRDTVLVPPRDSVTIAFDADNPGDWPLHCHNLYHMAAGMMTTVRYVQT